MRKKPVLMIKYMAIVSLLLLVPGCKQKYSSVEAFNYLISVASSAPSRIDTNYQADDSLPKRHDLREFDLVTPVKNQNPWNTCWGFAAIAAAETSILSSLNLTYTEKNIDLSERQLIWFSKSHVINEEDSQYGEGLYYNENDSFDAGGFTYTATSVFSSGTGVLSERLVPYCGNNKVVENGKSYYSKNDDWSVDEKYRHLQEYKLTESNVLPCPVVRDTQGKYAGYNAYATDCIKKELLSGKAVTICYHSEKGNETDGPNYLNTENNKWTHYTYDDAQYSHSVTIVGYDDSVPKEDFLDHSNKVGDPLQPIGDGAWIVKNSWGCENQVFPNKGIWGIKDKDDKATGYFYLSYYDHSLYGPESFSFEPSVIEDKYIINQYDFLQSKSTKSIYSTNVVKMANVFSNSVDKKLKAVSIETCNENIDVNIKLYLLNDDFKNPEDGQLIFDNDYHFVYGGFHKIDFERDYVAKVGQNISVVVTQSMDVDNTTYYEIFVDTQLKVDEEGNIRAKGIVNPGESFLYIGEYDSWYDWSGIVGLFCEDKQLGEYVYDNFPIKAYSNIVSE